MSALRSVKPSWVSDRGYVVNEARPPPWGASAPPTDGVDDFARARHSAALGLVVRSSRRCANGGMQDQSMRTSENTSPRYFGEVRREGGPEESPAPS
jgi:hypothetical protein